MSRQLILAIFFFNFWTLNTSAQTNTLIESTNSILKNEKLKAYHGWIKYLIYDVQVVANRPGNSEEQIREKKYRLKSWIKRINENPNVIKTLRGLQEWAYESPVDGSGQPFMINIAKDYNGSNPVPLSVYMHGYSGNHAEHFENNDTLKGMIKASALGRSRAGGFIGLSRADVIHVLDYIEANWNIDLDRVHILGGSMGGHGTFSLASRYPHRFASARITCGFAGDKPFGNLLTLPIYAQHSIDDFNVPIVQSSAPLERLQELGGQVIFDWTTGLGHASWNYKEANKRSNIWFRQQKRKPSQEIKHINFTALDGVAKRCWWAEIEEWGNKPKPAKFILTANNDNNTLYGKLTNINQLKLRINESPFDISRILNISINGAPPIAVKSPLPNVIYLKKINDSWQVASETNTMNIRRHTPGGANLLYNGEPLLIVYGTTGSKKENKAMLNAAKFASKSSYAAWRASNGDTAPDGTIMNFNLYGKLNIKADIDVTKADIERCHLVLIGTERQNKVVASIANRLPVSFSKKEITFSDGENCPADGYGLGLVYYNPDMPQKLIFWVASNDLRAYRADASIPAQMALTFPMYASSPPGFDCLISLVGQPSMVEARSFNSNWDWIPRNGRGKKVSSSIKTSRDYYAELSKAIKKETGADYAFAERTVINDTNYIPCLPGVTLLEDLVNKYYYEPIGIATLSGSELLTIQSKLEEKGLSITPIPNKDNIDAETNYTLAVNQNSIWMLVEETSQILRNFKLKDTQLSEAVKKFFPRE